MFETLKDWDRQLFIYLNRLGSENMDSFWLFVTKIESWTFLFVIFFFLTFKYCPRKKGALVVTFMVATFLLTWGIKYLTKISIARIRPNNLAGFSDTIRILQFPVDFSFFSGHASVSFAVTTFWVLSLKKYTHWVFIFYLWPLLFSFSRIYVGVHFPSDILVGAFVGIFIGFVMYFLMRKAERRWM